MFLFQPQTHFAQCHASTLVQRKDDTIFFAWFAGTKEANPDTAIWMCTQKTIDNKLKNLSDPMIVAKINDLPHWNPVLFTSDYQKIYLFFKVGHNVNTWETYWMFNEKDKWSSPKKLVNNLMYNKLNRGPVRSRPIVLSNGNWIAPSSREDICDNSTLNPFGRPNVIWKAFVDISTNEGKTWKMSKYIDFNREKFGNDKKYGGVIQPTLWESSKGNVHMLLRSTAGYIFKSDSSDYGETWSQAYPISLPNNNSGIEVVNLNNMLVLIYNPVSGNWVERTPISFSISMDNGRNWSDPRNIKSGPGSFSYPSACILSDKSIGITYTYNRIAIDFCKIVLQKKEEVV